MIDDPLTPHPLDPATIQTPAGPVVMSPSPIPGDPSPQRRQADTATYATEWSILLGGILTWAASFFVDMAAYEHWSEILSPKFIGLHIGQLAGVVAAIAAAKRIK